MLASLGRRTSARKEWMLDVAGSSELLSKSRNADSHENPCVNKVSRSTIYRGRTPGLLLVNLLIYLE